MKRRAHFRHPEQRTRLMLRASTRKLPVRGRIDAVLLSGLVFTLGVIAAGWLSVVWVGNQRGWFEPPLVQPVADDRILINLRAELATKPLLDGVLHGADQRLYLAQAGGWLHQFDPATGLWASTQPFAAEDWLQSDLIALRSGCGADALSERQADCPDPTSLWALSAGGGLARQTPAGWQLLVSETAFVNSAGEPVEQADLISAAVSEDQRWLGVGTRSAGVGLYNLQQGRWVSVSLAGTGLEGAPITQLVWWAGHLWAGSPAGLAEITATDTGATSAAVEAARGAIMDLEAQAEGGLHVLLQRPCAMGGANCLWLARWTSPGGTPQVLLDEQHQYAQLSLDRLSFAQQWDDTLVVAGASGIFRYDLRRHDWQQEYEGRIVSTLPLAQGHGFYFGFLSGWGRLTPDQFQTWDLPNEQVNKLIAAADDEVLALTSAGNVYAVRAGGEPASVFTQGATHFDPAGFTTAVATTEVALLFSRQGVLVHNVVARTYQDVAAADMPAWVTDAATQWVAAGSEVYALVPNAERLSVYALAVADLLRPGFFTTELLEYEPYQIRGPSMTTWAWGRSAIGVLTAEGQVLQLTPTGMTTRLGPAGPDLDEMPLLDVAGLGADLLALTSEGVRRYAADKRQWGAVFGQAQDDPAQELVTWGEQLLARTASGALVELNAAGVTPVIAGAPGFSFGEAQLSDALAAGPRLYLAGDGRIEAYDLDQRRIVNRWHPALTGPVTLKGLVSGDPVALIGDRAVLGDEVLGEDFGPALSLSTDGASIWAVHQGASGRFLAGYGAANRCFFRNPTSGGPETQVLDARALADGTVMVATEAGVRFYSPAARSWYGGSSEALAAGTRLYHVGDYLVLVAPNGVASQISFISTDSIRLPASCATGRATYAAEVVTVQSVAVDEAGGRLAWLEADGTVLEWQNGTARPVLPARSIGPDAAQFRRIFQRPNVWLVATEAGLWRYDLAARRWSAYTLDLPTTAWPLADMNVESTGPSEVVSVRAATGEFYLGDFKLDQTTAITLRRLVGSAAERFGAAAEHLLAVQQASPEVWTFVLDDQLKYYDAVDRQWLSGATFAEVDASRVLRQGVGVAVVESAAGRVWQVARPGVLQPTQFARYTRLPRETTALTSAGAIWRFDPDTAQVEQCPRPTTGDYACASYRPAPLALSPAAVRFAAPWKNLIVFVDGSNVRLYDPAGHRPVELVDAVTVPAGPLVTRTYQDSVWWYGENRLVILSASSSANVTMQEYPEVSALIFDERGEPWGRLADGWRHWVNAQPTAPGGPDDLRLLPVERAQVTAIGPAGLPYYWNGTTLVASSLPLPTDIAWPAITQLVRLSDTEWWVLSGSRIQHVIQGNCPGSGAPIVTATPAITGTPAATSAPATNPCLQVAGTVDLRADLTASGATALLCARLTGLADLELTRADGAVLVVPASNPAAYQSLAAETAGACRPGQMPNAWGTLAANLVTLSSGASVYDPPTGFAISAGGALQVLWSSEALAVAPTATLQLEAVAPLDVGWLRWEPATQTFVVATPQGQITLPKDRFVTGGQLLFEAPQAVLALSLADISVANAYGVWHYSEPSLSLNNAGVTFQPLNWSGPFLAAHENIWVSEGAWRPGLAAPQPLSDQVEVNLGAVQLTELIRSRSVSGQVVVSGNTLPALTSGGFLWDHARLAVAYIEGEVWLQSTAGLHPAQRLAGFDQGPQGQALTSAPVTSESTTGWLSFDRQTWFRREAAGWAPAGTDPMANRPLVANAQWAWALVGGRVQITPAGAPYAFALEAGAQGLGFSSDRLQGAVLHAGQLYVMSAAYLEVAQGPGELETSQAARFGPQPTDRLDTVSNAASAAQLLRWQAGALTVWDPVAQSFGALPAAANPYQARWLVQLDRLRLSWNGAQVVKEVRVEDIAGQSYWLPFALTSAGQFPFDVVTSLAVAGPDLWVGSAVGVQVYTGPMGLGRSAHWYSLPTAAAALTPIQRVGQPVAEPGVTLAIGPAGCLERKADGSLLVCATPERLAERLRWQTDLWQWVQDAQGQVQGEYLDATTGAYAAEVHWQAGRWSHDQLVSVVVCAGQAHSLTADGWVMRHPDDTLRLQAGLRFYGLSALSGQQLVCVDHDVPLAAGVLARGVYLAGAEQRFWQAVGETWVEVVAPSSRAELQLRVVRPPVLDRNRLRLLPAAAGGGSVTFEQRAANGAWQPIPWLDGRLAIDDWRELVAWGDALLAATPAGVVAFERGAEGAAVIDPDKLRIIREPQVEGALCIPTDLMTAAAVVLARCKADSAWVFTGEPGAAADVGVFHLATGPDPFAEQMMVDQAVAEYWEWRRVERVGGDPGHLTADFCAAAPSTEPRVCADAISLIGGRFGFDTVNSLARLTPGQLELASDGEGWFSAPVDDLQLSAWRRPVVPGLDPRALQWVGVTRLADQLRLCLGLNGTAGPFTVWAPGVDPEDRATCQPFLGDDGLWRYEQKDGQLLIQAYERALGGTAERQLMAGRFSDDQVLGLPVTGQEAAGPYYLVPTRAGVLHLNAAGRKQQIFAGAFDGLAEGAVPQVLYMDGAQPLYAAADGFRRLTPSLPYLVEPALLNAGSAGFQLTAVEDGPQASVRLRGVVNGQASWVLVGRADTQVCPAAGADAFCLEVSQYAAYTQQSLAWGQPTPWMVLQFRPDEATAMWAGGGPGTPLPLPTDFQLVAPLVVGRRLYLVGAHEFLELNLERAMRAAFEAHFGASSP